MKITYKEIVRIIEQKHNLIEIVSLLYGLTEYVRHEQHGLMDKEDEEMAIQMLEDLRKECKSILKRKGGINEET